MTLLLAIGFAEGLEKPTRSRFPTAQMKVEVVPGELAESGSDGAAPPDFVASHLLPSPLLNEIV